MRAAVVLCLGFGFVSFVACGSANVDSIFSKDCTKDDDCGAGSVCKMNVCTAAGTGGTGSSGGASSTGGASESGGQVSSSGGEPSAGGSSSGGTRGSGGSVETGGDTSSGGAMASGGAENTGGSASGGQSPDAGSGGSPGDGGSAGTGGKPETGGSKGSGGSPNNDDGVYCGNRYCPEEQVCCYTIRVGGPGVPMPVSNCSANACAGTEIQISCSAHGDCPQNKKCCQVPNSLQAFQCLDDCPAAEIECTGSNVCKDGDVCCETTEGTGAGETPTATKCQSQCKGENGSNEYILCHSNADCPNRLPRCASSNLLAGFKRCWPAN